ncbi:hypothetical protein PSQ19_06660 [Devosia algicola]|uniref:Uncharacterized protein n=1 Tax=Devosia algicola TaxID=3026418 RepID=A0ABY7YR15_9HYPH|nr:hypothetical protein [Devosia algicola]WDR03731.1 hypothetical protein PSQ19_06660 [Devosia algicola]
MIPVPWEVSLEGQGVDFTAHVVGFGLTDEEGKQVACLAENTGGQYLAANDETGLAKALETTVAEAVIPVAPEPKPEPKPAPLDYNFKPSASFIEGGPDIVDDQRIDLVWKWYTVAADGGEGEYVGTNYHSAYRGMLDPGDYFVTATMANASVSQKVTIKTGKVAEPHFVLNAAMIKLHPRPFEGADLDKGATVTLKWAGDQATNYGDVSTIVPAGDIVAEVKIGAAVVSENLTAVAGETIDKDIVVGIGLAHIATEYIEDMAIDDDVFLEISKAKKSLDGSRESVASGYGGEQSFELPPGDYVVSYKLDAADGEKPLSVTAGERTDLIVVIDAGVLAVTAPGNDFVEIFYAKKDIKGNRKSAAGNYGNLETTLPAGDYIVVRKEVEKPVSISAGERSELSFE